MLVRLLAKNNQQNNSSLLFHARGLRLFFSHGEYKRQVRVPENQQNQMEASVAVYFAATGHLCDGIVG